MYAAGRTGIMIRAMLSGGPSICSILRHGGNSHWHDGVSVTGDFLAAKVGLLLRDGCYGFQSWYRKID